MAATAMEISVFLGWVGGAFFNRVWSGVTAPTVHVDPPHLFDILMRGSGGGGGSL